MSLDNTHFIQIIFMNLCHTYVGPQATNSPFGAVQISALFSSVFLPQVESDTSNGIVSNKRMPKHLPQNFKHDLSKTVPKPKLIPKFILGIRAAGGECVLRPAFRLPYKQLGRVGTCASSQILCKISVYPFVH